MVSLEIEMELKPNRILVVRLQGELDHHTSDEIRGKISGVIDEQQIRYLVLNVENLTFMDSSGLGVILGRYKQLKEIGGELIVCAPPPPVKRLFELSGLFKIVRFEPSETAALERLGVLK
jgi:anti-sigma F factor antagonist